MAGAVIRCQRKFLIADFELAIRDPIAVAADRRSKIRMPFQISVQLVEPEINNIADLAIAVSGAFPTATTVAP